MSRHYLHLTKWDGGVVYGPYIDVFTDTVIAIEQKWDLNPNRPLDYANQRYCSYPERSLLYFVGGSTLLVCESPGEIARRIESLHA
jgi:hypothetical protein